MAQPSSAEQRAALGRAARRSVPRSSLGAFEPAPDRPDPVEQLVRDSATCLPELLPIRFGRMLASPFAFFRGAAPLMAADLAGSPVSGFRVQCCGDAHLANFGLFASPERRLVFDVNDFDETLPGPWEWDLKRLAASLLVAARDRGLSAADQERAVRGAAASYREWMGRLAAEGNLAVWYAHVDVEALAPALLADADARTRRRADRIVAKARRRDGLDALARLTRIVDGEPRFVSRPPLLVPVDELVPGERDLTIAALGDILATYRASLADDRRVLYDRYRLVDFARKVVGVGSVGTRCFVALLEGRHDGDPLLLQIKEAGPSALEAALGASTYPNAGQRVVEGQRLMLATSDIFLGWLGVGGAADDEPRRDFYVRQLRDWKLSASIEEMTPQTLIDYGRLCGATLARAHARGGQRLEIAAYLGRGDVVDRAMVAFAEAYAEQNARDHAALAAAVRDGRVDAVSGI